MKTDHNAVVIALLAEISSRLSSLEGKVAEMEAACIRREKRNLRQRRYRDRKADNRSVTNDAPSVTNDGASVTNDAPSVTNDAPTKKEKGEREISPQTPYIEKEGKKKERLLLSTARACEGSDSALPATDKLVDDCKLNGNDTPPHPTLEQVIQQYTTKNPSRYPESVIREWYAECEMCGWRDGEGNPIRNFGKHLNVWRQYYDVNKRRADPDRIPDARVAAQKRNIVHADNWRGTKPENLQHVF